MKDKTVKQIGVKLYQSDIDKLDVLRDGKSIAYTIRQLIRENS